MDGLVRGIQDPHVILSARGERPRREADERAPKKPFTLNVASAESKPTDASSTVAHIEALDDEGIGGQLNLSA